MATRYLIRLPNPSNARGEDASLSFRSQGAEGIAEELQHALRSDALFARWLEKQEEPGTVDPALSASDTSASVSGMQEDLHIDLTVITRLSSAVLRHRLALLAGNHWQLRDVSAA
ncbi:MAG: hypothetical protein KUL77_02335 [Thermomonas sp.]|uniref:hypothetical protein n=1 Tax=Thermomonas sp. TaxID=1971895 RepID=UPI001EBA51A4|nr:hypothetical protein [Thermomonas sp.]MBV2208385.1 hypothetical protein [Thermomonas sp.]